MSLSDSRAEWDVLSGKENLQTSKKGRTDETAEPFKQSNRFGVFGKPASEEEIQTFVKGFVPSTTKASNISRDLHNFCHWRSWRPMAKPDDPVPDDLLERCDAIELSNKKHFKKSRTCRDGIHNKTDISYLKISSVFLHKSFN